MWHHPSVQLKRSDEFFLLSESRLSQSYQRCESAGIEYGIAVAQDILGGDALNTFLEKHRDLAHHVNDLFSRTLQHLQDQKSLFILTDGEGRAITVFSRPEVLASAETRGIVAGASLKEDSLGTNAVSLALCHAEPIVLRGDQHFCRIFADWYCVAVPLMGSDGEPIACIDISTCCKETLGEKVALAHALAGELQALCRTEHAIPTTSLPLPAQTQPLTVRQQQALTLFSQGLSYKQIAQKLQIRSHKTVEKHLDSVRVKFVVKTRRECIQKAMEMNLL